MKQLLRILYIVMPILTIILIVIQVVVSNELASLGKKLGKLDTEISFAQDVYADLSTQVASASSLSTLRERALGMGFREPTQAQIIALTPEVPVALRLAQ